MTIELRNIQRNLPDEMARRTAFERASGLRRHYPADHEDERFRRINALLTVLVAGMNSGSISPATKAEVEAVKAEILDPKTTGWQVLSAASDYEQLNVAVAEFDMPDGSTGFARVSEALYRNDPDRDWLGEQAQQMFDAAEAQSLL